MTLKSVNKSNFMLGAVQDEANLLETFVASAIFYSSCTRKCWTLKMKIKVMEYSNRNGPIRWQISTSIKVKLEHFH